MTQDHIDRLQKENELLKKEFVEVRELVALFSRRDTWEKTMERAKEAAEMYWKKQKDKEATSKSVGTGDFFGVWTSVEQALPALETEVLVCEHDHDGKLYVSTLAFRQLKTPWIKGTTETEWRVSMNCGGSECEPDDCNPTHWMPIPIPPNPKLTDAKGSDQPPARG